MKNWWIPLWCLAVLAGCFLLVRHVYETTSDTLTRLAPLYIACTTGSKHIEFLRTWWKQRNERPFLETDR